MIELGKVQELVIIRTKEFGVYLAEKPTSKEADTINKLAAAIEKMEKETGIADIISVSKGILDWIRKTDTDKDKRNSAFIFDAYIKDRLK